MRTLRIITVAALLFACCGLSIAGDRLIVRAQATVLAEQARRFDIAWAGVTQEANRLLLNRDKRILALESQLEWCQDELEKAKDRMRTAL